MKKKNFTLPWRSSLIKLDDRFLKGTLCSQGKNKSIHVDYGSKFDFYVPNFLISQQYKEKVLDNKGLLKFPISLKKMEDIEGDFDLDFQNPPTKKSNHFDNLITLLMSDNPYHTGLLIRRVNKGFRVGFAGITAFLPGSLLIERGATYLEWKKSTQKFIGHFILFKPLQLWVQDKFNGKKKLTFLVSRLEARDEMKEIKENFHKEKEDKKNIDEKLYAKFKRESKFKYYLIKDPYFNEYF